MNTVTKFIGARTGIGKNMKKEFLRIIGATLLGFLLLGCQGPMGPQEDVKTVILGQGFREAIQWINEVDETGATMRKGRLMSGGAWPDESTATDTTPANRRLFIENSANYYIENPNATKEDYVENEKKLSSRWITFTFPASNIRGA